MLLHNKIVSVIAHWYYWYICVNLFGSGAVVASYKEDLFITDHPIGPILKSSNLAEWNLKSVKVPLPTKNGPI